MKAKFTKGEWKPIEHLYNGSFEVISGQSGERIAYLNQGEHNAHLIAASPEMYEMLEILTHTCRLMTSKTPLKSEFEALQAGIEQVLSKARGEQ